MILKSEYVRIVLLLGLINFSNIIKVTIMSLSYCGSKENKENQYHHDIQISPEKRRNNNLRTNFPGNEFAKKGKDDDIISPTLLKTRKQLVELWLNPVVTLDTSLEQIVEDEDYLHECSCMKEHL